MPVQYAGVDLTPPNSAIELFNVWWHGHRITEFDFPGYNARWQNHLPLPPVPQTTPPRIGALYWPSGASRWATCHLICTGAQLTDIRNALGNTAAAATLDFWDGTTDITASMWLLPPRPISQRGDGYELYLLTLVDERWFWWMAGNQTAPQTAPTSWADLFSSLFTAIGVTPTVDTIPSAYGVPSPIRWDVESKPIPLLIDAAAECVGMRVVRQRDGTVAVQSYATADAADAAAWAAYSDLVLAGGQITAADIARSVPAAVATVFWGYDPVIKTKTLASLAIAAYGGRTGVAGRMGQIIADMPATADNTAQTNYAAQAATDYYSWALAKSDYTLRKFQPRLINGNDAFVEWIHAPDQIVTRVVRSTLSDQNIYGDAPPQRGFPVQITSTYNATTGYSWERLTEDVTVPGFVTIPVPKTGMYLFNINDNRDLIAGDRALIWSNPDSAGWATMVDVVHRTKCVGGLLYDYISTDGGQTWRTPVSLGVACVESGSGSGSGSGSPCTACIPDSTSTPTGGDPLVLLDMQCYADVMYVVRAYQRLVWDATYNKPVIDYYGYEVFTEGCCACSGSGSGSGSGNLCPGPTLTLSVGAVPTSGDTTTAFAFTATPGGGIPPYTYAWSFGDGGTSTAQNPTHTYAANGSYSASCTVTDLCYNTVTASVVITVSGAPYGADCAASLTVPGAPISLGVEYGATLPANTKCAAEVGAVAVEQWWYLGVLDAMSNVTLSITTTGLDRCAYGPTCLSTLDILYGPASCPPTGGTAGAAGRPCFTSDPYCASGFTITAGNAVWLVARNWTLSAVPYTFKACITGCPC